VDLLGISDAMAWREPQSFRRISSTIYEHTTIARMVTSTLNDRGCSSGSADLSTSKISTQQVLLKIDLNIKTPSTYLTYLKEISKH
jgi:hypothetical protein